MTLPSLDFQDPELYARIAERSLVVSASAGSGKTFALVALVLGFLGRGGRPPQIVATTFGREAAADLRSRILQPLDQLSAWKDETWSAALEALRSGYEVWDRWLASRKPSVRAEIGAAARQWVLPGGQPEWMLSPAKAWSHWTRARREAELLQATTVHALAQSILRAKGGGDEALMEADDPALVRVLRAAGREVLNLPPDHPDHAGARRLWAWCEGFEEDRDRWNLLAAAFDAHLDALGTWRESMDASIPRERFFRQGKKILDSYAAFAAEPMRAAAITKQGKPHSTFQKSGMGKLQPEFVPDEVRMLDALDRLASRFLKADDGEPPTYYSEAFRDMLEPLCAELPEWLEAWMTLLLERVFQRFRDMKRERGFRSYGDLVREAWEQLQTRPEKDPPVLLLVDEYQDINPVQEAFLESLQANRTVLVGDPKQAIYGFRGGVPELLRAKLRAAALRNEAFRLPRNHRSSAPVVELANAFVRDVIPRLDPASADPDGTQEHGTEGEENRRVGLFAVPSAKQGSDLPAAAAWITALSRNDAWAAAGFETLEGPRRRALLLAKRTGLPALRRTLQSLRIEPLVQSREGFWDSPGVRLMMALLEAVVRPEADTARFAVLRSPWVGARDAELKDYAAEGRAGAGAGVARGLAWVDALRERSAQEIVAEGLARPGLLEFLAATAVHGALEPARARRNLELFSGWIPALPESPALALSELERRRALRDPGDAPAEDVNADLVVQTIHGSKGLEYDDVILPMLASTVKGVRKGTIRQRPGAPGKLWIGWKLGHARGPVLKELHGDESGRAFREGLNLLYVGLTRAKGRLVLLQQWPISKEGIAGPPPSGTERLAASKPVQWHHVASDLVNIVPELPCRTEAPSMSVRESAVQAILLPPERVPDRPSPSEAAATRDEARVRKGIQLHALLREVLVRDAVDAEAARAYLSAHPLVRTWPSAKSAVEDVLRELAARQWHRLPRRTEFELRGAGKTGGMGRADLVIWEPLRTNPSRIHLVDFKLAASFTDEALALHRDQLSAYGEALAAEAHGAIVEAWVVGLEGGGWIKVSPDHCQIRETS